MRCNFCDAPDPKWEYPMFVIATNELGLKYLAGTDETYLCSWCHHLVSEQDYGKLADFSVDAFILAHDLNRKEVIRKDLRRLMSKQIDNFIDHRGGPAKEVKNV